MVCHSRCLIYPFPLQFLTFSLISNGKADLSLIEPYVAKGLITTQKHSVLDLLIHNYSHMCQYDKAWDDVTKHCRGLITDLAGNVISRPFPKFFNLSEHETCEATYLKKLDWSQPFVATKKYDGSLGVLYRGHDGWSLATRGSFCSTQAIEGTRIFRSRGYDKFEYPSGMTFLFEILFPENRIVVNYGGLEDCVLLDVIATDTGESASYAETKFLADQIGCPVAERIEASEQSLRSLAVSGLDNAEGFVVRFANGDRVKMKFPEYVRLHRLLTGISNRKIWEELSEGRSLEALLEGVPDEFYDFVKDTEAALRSQFHQYMNEAQDFFLNLKNTLGCDATRRHYAEVINQHDSIAPIVFAILSGKDPAPIVWKKIRPLSITRFTNDADA